VRFSAAELWGPGTAEPNAVVYYDVWEPYLILAP
jgi:nitrile hydratase